MSTEINSTDEIKKTLETYFKKHDWVMDEYLYDYAKSDECVYDDHLLMIYNLFIRDIIPSEEDLSNEKIQLMLSIYYEIKEDYENMLTYNLMLHENNRIDSSCALGRCYKYKKDYDNMIKFFLIAVERGDSYAMRELGDYYAEINDYENMIKYYQMGIDENNTDCMYNLALYYGDKEDYDNMKKYYEMAINLGDVDAMQDLGDHYAKINDLDNMMRYYLLGAENENKKSITAINDFYDKNFIMKYVFQAQKYFNTKNLIKLNEILKCISELSSMEQKFDVVTCSVCHSVDIKAIYRCSCEKIEICCGCYLKTENCPVCKNYLR